MEFDQYSSRTTVEDAPELHMWLTWREMADSEGWPMPDLALKRNVYWDDETVHLVNGQQYKTAPDEWLAGVLPASTEIVPQAHRGRYARRSNRISRAASQITLPALPQPCAWLWWLTRSRSMQVMPAW